MAALQSVLYLADVYAIDGQIELFDLEEGELVTWTSSSAAFAAGISAFLLGFVDPAQRVRGPLVALGATFISFDDAIFLHERIASRLTDALGVGEGAVEVVWPALYLPLLVALAVLLLRLARESSVAHRLIVAGLALLAGAVVLEVSAAGLNWLDVRDGSPLSVAEIVLEEAAEVSGWILVATGGAVRLVLAARGHSVSG